MKRATMILALLLVSLAVNISLANSQAVAGLQEATFVVA